MCVVIAIIFVQLLCGQNEIEKYIVLYAMKKIILDIVKKMVMTTLGRKRKLKQMDF